MEACPTVCTIFAAPMFEDETSTSRASMDSRGSASRSVCPPTCQSPPSPAKRIVGSSPASIAAAIVRGLIVEPTSTSRRASASPSGPRPRATTTRPSRGSRTTIAARVAWCSRTSRSSSPCTTSSMELSAVGEFDGCPLASPGTGPPVAHEQHRKRPKTVGTQCRFFMASRRAGATAAFLGSETSCPRACGGPLGKAMRFRLAGWTALAGSTRVT